jgi:hypothetical protein
MLIAVRVDAGEVRKRAESEQDRRQIQREAAVLTAVAHPGVVQLLTTEGDPVDTLVLRRVGTGSLDDLHHADVEVLAGVGASLATTVADLHEIGFVHRAITGPHVLLDEQGSPVLCGFGSALGPLPGSELAAHRVEDVRAIATILLERVPVGDRRLRSVLRRAEGGRQWSRRCDARWLARRLVEVVPDARLGGGESAYPTERLDPEQARDPVEPVGVPPDGAELAGATRVSAPARNHVTVQASPALETEEREDGSPAGASGGQVLVRSTTNPGGATGSWPRRHVRLARLAAGGLAAGAALAGGAAIVVPGLSGSGAASPRCPPVDQGCGQVGSSDGVITTTSGRFDLTSNAAGSIVVLGRWGCTDQALPAELDVRTGDVWVFDRWPGPGGQQPARLAGTISSASGLSVRPGEGRCDLIEVRRKGHASVTVNPRAAGPS